LHQCFLEIDHSRAKIIVFSLNFDSASYTTGWGQRVYDTAKSRDLRLDRSHPWHSRFPSAFVAAMSGKEIINAARFDVPAESRAPGLLGRPELVLLYQCANRRLRRPEASRGLARADPSSHCDNLARLSFPCCDE
jgi:hypothetical protein